jgi:hypothetical protein
LVCSNLLWKLIGITCLRIGALKPWWNYFLEMFKTLPRPWKDENKKKEKKNWVAFFKTVSYLDPTILIKTKDLPNTGWIMRVKKQERFQFHLWLEESSKLIGILVTFKEFNMWIHTFCTQLRTSALVLNMWPSKIFLTSKLSYLPFLQPHP